MTRWHTDTRCEDGRLLRHDPQFDDPYLETDIGECPECDGRGCDRPAPVSGEGGVMRCERCHGTGKVGRHTGWTVTGDPLPSVPLHCIDCLGSGVQHCCDGLTAANDAPADPEDTDEPSG